VSDIRTGLQSGGGQGHYEPDTISSHKWSPVRFGIDRDVAFLHKFGMGIPYLEKATHSAKRQNVTAAHWLIANNLISETNYYKCVAEELGVAFAENTPNTGEPFFNMPKPDALDKLARMVPVDGPQRILHIAPDMRQIDVLKRLLERYPSFANRLKVTPPTTNKATLEERGQISLLDKSINGLWNRMPNLSARTTLSPNQAVFILVVIQVLCLLLIFSDRLVQTFLYAAITAFYLSCVAIRMYAACAIDINARKRELDNIPRKFQEFPANMPIYSVLVAVYQESGQIDDLVKSLNELHWPREKIEIRLICEADDAETIFAARRAVREIGGSQFAVVVVPAQHPRTKPKALNYALPLCRGRYLVIYDAEDRPDPYQLLEAYQTFQSGPENLVCLQAPLTIHNHREAWLSRMFATEYSALFDGLLPVLAKHKLPLPLGGTSNHFKRAVLESAGGWDPFNVTEDADLGIRFARLGYQTATLVSPTYEEAPIDLSVWVKQRTRWFKGWLQTWLVHLRQPVRMIRELGIKGALTFHVLITGMIVSALIHPVLLYFLAEYVWLGFTKGPSQLLTDWYFWLDLSVVTLGYFAFSALAWRTLGLRKLKPLRQSLLGVPVYWLLLSVAAWRALFHLMIKPHEWEKTPHRLRSRATGPSSKVENASIT